MIGKNLAQPFVFPREPVSLHPHAAQENIVSQQIVVNHRFILRHGIERMYLIALARHAILSPFQSFITELDLAISDS